MSLYFTLPCAISLIAHLLTLAALNNYERLPSTKNRRHSRLPIITLETISQSIPITHSREISDPISILIPTCITSYSAYSIIPSYGTSIHRVTYNRRQMATRVPLFTSIRLGDSWSRGVPLREREETNLTLRTVRACVKISSFVFLSLCLCGADVTVCAHIISRRAPTRTHQSKIEKRERERERPKPPAWSRVQPRRRP